MTTTSANDAGRMSASSRSTIDWHAVERGEVTVRAKNGITVVEARVFSNGAVALLHGGHTCCASYSPEELQQYFEIIPPEPKREAARSHPCDDGCQYSKDVGMWPQHSCGDDCMYEKAGRATPRDAEPDVSEAELEAALYAYIHADERADVRKVLKDALQAAARVRTHQPASAASMDRAVLHALELAEGRLRLLMNVEYPGSDHPVATRYVLQKVSEILAALRAAEASPASKGER